MSRARAALATMLVAALAGCWLPRPSAPTRVWVLTAPTPDASGASAVARELGVGPVEIAAYLDRRELVSRVDASELRVSFFDFWGEPLQRGILRVLALALVDALPGLRTVALPNPRPPAFRVSVAVSRFDSDAEGAVTLVAEWSLARVGDGEPLAGAVETVIEPGGGSDAAQRVAAMSRALEALARRIAPSVATFVTPRDDTATDGSSG